MIRIDRCIPLVVIGLGFLALSLLLKWLLASAVNALILLFAGILSAVPPVFPGYMQTPSTALYVIFPYLVILFLESYLITPLVQQREVSQAVKTTDPNIS